MKLLLTSAACSMALASVMLLTGCSGSSGPAEHTVSQPAPESPPPVPPVQRGNPASVNCIEQGGKSVLERNPSGGEYRVCTFPDNLQCEEWALFRGECRFGGIKVSGDLTPAARYCAITGGKYSVVAHSGQASEQGTCMLPGGKNCDADAFYKGTCNR